MPIALPALDLAAWLIFAVIFVLALTAQKWLRAVFQVVDKVVGWAPFVGNWIKSGENHVLSVLNAIVVSSRAAMATLLDGVRWSIREFETGVRDFADATQNAYENLTAHAIPGALNALFSQVDTLIRTVTHRLDVLEGKVADVGPAIRRAADAAQAAALAAAAAYADGAIAKLQSFVIEHVRGVYKEVEDDIATAQTAAERYADTAVAALRHAEDAAIAAAAAAGTAALEHARTELSSAIGAVSAALATTKTTIEGEIQTAQTSAAQALSAAETAIETDVAARAQAAADALAATAQQLTGAIATAETAAETAARTALGAEAHTLETAIADASSAASAALDAARATVESELGAAAATAAAELHTTAQQLSGAIATVTGTAQALVAELASAEAAATGELADIYNLPADALRNLLDGLDLTKVASFGAGLVLVRALVGAIAREAGLDSAECRAKNRQICATPGGEWGDLLAGAAFVTGALSLAELVPIGRAAIGELSGAIRQAA